ncbi:hypothetical protein OZK63_41145, partial [Streptomyces sp. UMAF16]|nr:hypothetical protein [Streptomyces sp. UMAF16]
GLTVPRMAYLLDITEDEVRNLHELMVKKTGIQNVPKIKEDSNLRYFSIKHNLARMADYRAFLAS